MCPRTAHNRTLHYDQYVALLLLFFFNPIVTSTRRLVQASSLDKVRKKLGVSSTSLGSFSEAASIFDPELLKGVPAEFDLTQATHSEVDNLLKRLLPGRVYVKDRGYACFRLFQSSPAC
jgi:hypothetical protein